MLDLNMLKEKFPAVPLERLAKLAIRPGAESTEIAWNRRMRRSIERADRWSKRVPTGWVIVNVDILQNQDLNDSTMAYLMDVLAGPAT